MTFTSKKFIVIAIVIGMAICCVCFCIACGVLTYATFRPQSTFQFETSLAWGTTATPTPRVVRPTETASDLQPVNLTATPDLWVTEPPTSAPSESILDILNKAEVPVSDLPDLASRLQGKSGIPVTLTPPPAPLKTGDQQSFWVTNNDTNVNFQVPATLHYITPHAYFWIEDGVHYRQKDLQALADTFEQKIYPSDRAFFGSEWSPGVDDDVHLYILYAKKLGSTLAGYFSSTDEYNPALRKYSNGHEMFVFNADTADLADEYTYSVLAHEFQHMIHWYRDRNEEAWMNEGFAELAAFINGFGVGNADRAYIDAPDIQLNDWPTDYKITGPHYGASFLFLTYFLDRFGEQTTKDLVGGPENGLTSIDDLLQKQGYTDPQTGKPIVADNVFLDWSLANYLKDGKVGDGRYTYHNYPDSPKASNTETIRDCSKAPLTRDVHQYGVDYIDIKCAGKTTLNFEGSIQTNLIPADPHSGKWALWSNKGDESDMTLTHDFDFTNSTGPLSLQYWTWYDVEKDYDYVYLEASLDGKNWQLLHTPSGTGNDPTGANYGWGYTGASGGNKKPEWIQENVDLSAYAGKKVQLRFEYITDAAVNGEGFVLDDISIPQIEYATDFEQDNGDWQAAGFARIENQLPQTFRLAIISRGQTTTVQYITLTPDNTANIPLDFSGNVTDAVLVVTGTTRFTRQPAAYRLSFGP